MPQLVQRTPYRTPSRGRSYVTPSTIAAARSASRMVYSAGQSWLKRRRSASTPKKSSKGKDDSTPLYGTSFTSKVGYRARRPNRRRARAARVSFGKFINNSMKLQNAQNSVNTGAYGMSNVAGQQAWYSLDLCNVNELWHLIKSQLPAGQGATSRDFQLMLKTFQLRFFLQNVSTNNAMVDIYHLVPRRDVSQAEFTSAGLTLPDPSNGNVFSSWFNARTDITNVAASDQLQDTEGDPVPNNLIDGYTPFMYTNLCRMYKITKIRNLVLGAGQTYTERDTVLNRRINMASLGGSTTSSTFTPEKWYMKGISRITLFRVRGFPTDPSGSPVAHIDLGWEVNTTCKVVQTRLSSSATIGGI